MGLFRGQWGRAVSAKRLSKSKRRLGALGATSVSLEPLEDRRMLALLGVSPDFPLIAYNSTGVLNYDAVAQSFDLDATPLSFKESLVSPVRPITNTPVPSFEISILVDNTGQVIGGVPGPDLRVFGDIDLDGDTVVDVSGVLLTGEVMQFGSQNVGTTDFFDFRFKVTGGLIANLFAGKDIVVFNSSENSTFTGSFATNFRGGAKGTLGTADALVADIAIDKSVVHDVACEADMDGNGVVALFKPNDIATYNYAVSNPGNVALDITSLVDVNDNGTPGNPGDDIVINPTPVEAGGFNVGDLNTNNLVDPGEVWQFTADVLLTNLGTTSNEVTVVGDPVNANGSPILNLDDATATDDLSVFVAQAGVTIEKRVNGQDSNVEPPPFDHVLQGAQVDFTYFITNTGNVILDLNNPLVFEDDGGVGPSFTPISVLSGGFNIGDANTNGLFDPGESWEYEFLNVTLNTLGLNTNTVNLQLGALDINGEPVDPICVPPANASDVANIIVDLPRIQIDKTVVIPGCEADVNGQGVVPLFEVGDIAMYHYAVANTGTTVLNITTLQDTNDNGTPGNPGDDVVIVPTPILAGGFNVGDTNTNGRFDPGEIWEYESQFALAGLGMYSNEVVVQAAPAANNGTPLPGFSAVSDFDTQQLFVAMAEISIEKRVNGQDANVEPPPFQHVLQGGTVSYTYLVTNNGNLPLKLTSLEDDGGPQPSFVPSPVLKANLKNIGDTNNNDLLDNGESWEFEKINYVIDIATPPGPFVNTATVMANPVDINGERILCFDPVEASDIATIIVDPLLGSLSGYVYEDCDNNGIRVNGDAGIPGTTVELFLNGGLFASTVTDAFGFYKFDDLPAGTYTIHEVQPPGFLDGIDTAGTIMGISNGTAAVETMQQVIDTISNVVLPIGEHGINYNFGELKSSSIEGFVYIDVNNNGVKDPGESPIPGVEIRLTGTDDRGNVVNVQVFTDANGEFFFAPPQNVAGNIVNGLRPADAVGYTLTQTHPILFVDGKDKAGTAGGVVNSPADIISGIMLKGCDNASGYLFGEFGLKVPSKRPFIFSDGQWHNETNPLDVNGDGRISSQDALIVIDTLNRLGLGTLPENNEGTTYPDTNNDGVLSPADLLAIINQINAVPQYAPGVVTNGGSTGGGVASSIETSGDVAQGLASLVESSDDSAAKVAPVAASYAAIDDEPSHDAPANAGIAAASLSDDEWRTIAWGLAENASQEDATDAAFAQLGTAL